MNILMVGSGKGSWTIRGEQLGAALGARVTSTPADSDYRWADRVVLVKRAGAQFAKVVHQHRKPLIWDAVDCWRQPIMHNFCEKQSHAWLRSQIAVIQPTVTIGATQAMAEACGGVYLPHHGWPGLKPTPARAEVKVVGYEGNSSYLGRWAGIITKACQALGWTFVMNPPDLREIDIFVALRDGQWDGWICRAWKSGVKLVNAICAGRPVVTQDTSAFRELRPEGSVIEASTDLASAFSVWSDGRRRAAVVEWALERAQDFDVRTIAERYRQILAAVPVCVH